MHLLRQSWIRYDEYLYDIFRQRPLEVRATIHELLQCAGYRWIRDVSLVLSEPYIVRSGVLKRLQELLSKPQIRETLVELRRSFRCNIVTDANHMQTFKQCLEFYRTLFHLTGMVLTGRFPCKMNADRSGRSDDNTNAKCYELSDSASARMLRIYKRTFVRGTKIFMNLSDHVTDTDSADVDTLLKVFGQRLHGLLGCEVALSVNNTKRPTSAGGDAVENLSKGQEIQDAMSNVSKVTAWLIDATDRPSTCAVGAVVHANCYFMFFR